MVTTVGPGDIRGLEAGDRVVVSAPGAFSTVVRLPTWSARRLVPHEDFATLSTLALAYNFGISDLFFSEETSDHNIHSRYVGRYWFSAFDISTYTT